MSSDMEDFCVASADKNLINVCIFVSLTKVVFMMCIAYVIGLLVILDNG